MSDIGAEVQRAGQQEWKMDEIPITARDLGRGVGQIICLFDFVRCLQSDAMIERECLGSLPIELDCSEFWRLESPQSIGCVLVRTLLGFAVGYLLAVCSHSGGGGGQTVPYLFLQGH